METIKKDRNGFISIELKLANMRNAQRFIIYPYSGGDGVLLQSDKRFVKLNIRTGLGVINKTNKNQANSITLSIDPIPFQITEELKIEFQAFFWNNNGKEGGGACIKWDNKELFSN